jgi:hypothetical protein
MRDSTSYSRLQDSIQLVKEEQIIKRQLLQEQLNISYESLKPLNLLRGAIRDMSSSPDLGNNVMGSVLGLGSGYLSKKLFIGTSGNLIRKLIGSFIQIGVSNLVARHPDAIKNFGQYLIEHFLSKKETKNRRSVSR